MGHRIEMTDTFMQTIRRNIAFIYQTAKKRKLASLLIIIAVFAVIVAIPNRSETEDVVNDPPKVGLINVGKASTDTTPLEVTGTVRSRAEAVLRTERQGEIVGVYRKVGDFVQAGTVIAEIKNASERAAVAQAEAALLKAKSGENVSVINVESARDSFETALAGAQSTLLSAYNTVDDGIRRKTDPMFSNPTSEQPHFIVKTSNSQLALSIENSRLEIGAILARQKGTTLSPTYESVLSELTVVSEEIKTIRTYLEQITTILNGAIVTNSVSSADIALYKTDATLALGSINALAGTITNTIDGIRAKKTAFDIAEQNAERGEEGVTADVALAEAGLAAARANLARTLIVSPISGTLNTLNIRQGDFVNAFDLAAIVSNNNALEIETYVSEEDKGRIHVGSTALISGKYEGVVTSVAPGLDPATKKIEVRVAVRDNNASLTHGNSVRLSLERNGLESTNDSIERIIIPIAALKVETSRVIVFTVSDKNTLVAHVVVPGLVLGDSVVITEGLTVDMDIVSDARGLREGEIVSL